MHKIELRRGEKYSLKLKGKGSVGYSWQHTVKGIPYIVEISIKKVSPKSKQSEDKIPPPTYDADQLFTVTAIRKGHAEIHIVHRRPWEHKKEPRKEIVLDVDIRE